MAVSTVTAQEKLKDAKKALYRECILDAAESVFADRGYEAAKVQEIAAVAGLSLATLYSVFDKKWALFRALHKRRLRQLMEQIATARAHREEPFAMIRSGIETYVRFHMENPNYLKMHLREGTLWATNDVLRCPEQTETWQAGLRMMTTAIKVGADAGVFMDEDPELMARTLIATHQVRLASWIDRGMKEGSDEICRYVTKQLVRTCCRPERLEEFMQLIGEGAQGVVPG